MARLAQAAAMAVARTSTTSNHAHGEGGRIHANTDASHGRGWACRSGGGSKEGMMETGKLDAATVGEGVAVWA
jgi:hypothetical protein